MPTRLGKWGDKNRWVYWIVRRRSCNGKAHYRWPWQWSCRRRVEQFSKLNETEMIPFTIFLCWAFYVLTLLLLKVTFKRYKISQCLLTHHGFPLESLFLFLSSRVRLFIQKNMRPSLVNALWNVLQWSTVKYVKLRRIITVILYSLPCDLKRRNRNTKNIPGRRLLSLFWSNHLQKNSLL